MYFVHYTLACLVTFSGAACFVCRLFPCIMWLHAHFGRAYIILMMWLMATSLLLHNTGLPIAVLISFVCVLGGITVGWMCIKQHQARMEQMAFAVLNGQQIKWYKEQADQREGKIELKTLSVEDFHAAKRTVASNKSWSERLFSAKAAHGIFMFISFVNILGRLGSTDHVGDFVCYTYPVYKQLDSAKFNGSSQALTFVPVHDPNYAKLPWAASDVYWGLELSVAPLAVAFVFGAVFSICVAKSNSKTKENGLLSNVKLSAPPMKTVSPPAR